jgi:hypothetical protein
MRAHGVRHGGLDGVGMGETHDDVARVCGAQHLECAHHPGLHLREALPIGKAER